LRKVTGRGSLALKRQLQEFAQENRLKDQRQQRYTSASRRIAPYQP
jgi:hypothetical protein